jgi:hypothetical protein
VRNYLVCICEKPSVSSRVELVHYAVSSLNEFASGENIKSDPVSFKASRLLWRPWCRSGSRSCLSGILNFDYKRFARSQDGTGCLSSD